MQDWCRSARTGVAPADLAIGPIVRAAARRFKKARIVPDCPETYNNRGTGPAQEAKTDEARAIAIIGQLQGEVIRDDSRPGKPVIEVRLFETDIDDSQLAILERLAGLRVLDLGQTGITDAGLAHLRGLTDLEELDVRNCEITIDGLLKLRGLPRLRRLGLCMTGMTDEALVKLQELHHLESLDLYDNLEKTAAAPEAGPQPDQPHR